MQIGGGIAHSVRMVDAQAVDGAVVEPSQHEVVRVEEDALDLDAQAHQGVHVEEAPVAEVARRRLPEGDAVVLALEERVEQVRRPRHALDLRLHRRRHLRPARGRAAPASGAAPPCGGDAGGWRDVGGGGRGQRPCASAMKGQLVRAAALRRRRQQGVDRARRHRPFVVVIADGEGAVLPPRHREERLLSTRPYWSSSDGQEHGVAELGLRRVPVHVEIGGVAGRRAVLQHVPPPAVVRRDDRHVVGDDVEELAHARARRAAARARESRLAAELGVDLPWSTTS
jgi:hypothetical protein